MRPRIPAAILGVALTTPLLLSCDKQESASNVDPQIGRECFELHRPTLPPGTQYEGFEVRGNLVTAKLMSGVALATVNCTLKPDGTLATEPEPSD